LKKFFFFKSFLTFVVMDFDFQTEA